MCNTTKLTLLSLFLLFGVVAALAALPQQPFPVEKKRAMNRFDPVDIFPEAREHAGKGRTKREKKSAEPSILAGNAALPGSEARWKPRRRKSSVAATATQPSETAAAGPAMSVGTTDANQATIAAPSATTDAAAARSEGKPAATQTPLPASPPQVAMNASSDLPAKASSALSPNPSSRGSLLSLPVILTLLLLVALALLVAVASLLKQFRRPIN